MRTVCNLETRFVGLAAKVLAVVALMKDGDPHISAPLAAATGEAFALALHQYISEHQSRAHGDEDREEHNALLGQHASLFVTQMNDAEEAFFHDDEPPSQDEADVPPPAE